jgi:hypothetical protein
MFASFRPFALTAILIMVATLVAVVMHARKIDSMLLQKGATLQYEGPLYIGDGEWERTYTPQIHTAILARTPLNKAGVNKQHQNNKMKRVTSTGSKLAVRSPTRKDPVISKTLKSVHKVKPLSKAVPSLSSDVGKLSDEISDGLTKIFHLHDNPVVMRSPVKILDHV